MSRGLEAKSPEVVRPAASRLLAWLEERANANGGLIPSFTKGEAQAAASGAGSTLQPRVQGMVQSMVDFACFRCGLPPLGLLARPHYAMAWRQGDRSWAYPIEAMRGAAREHYWQATDFKRLRAALAPLSAQPATEWANAAANEEQSLREWAYRFPGADAAWGGTPPQPWSEAELRAAVEAYLDMVDQAHRGERPNKRATYQALSQRFGRTAKAFEFRMQNISHVLSLMGREHLRGLRPASHVGAEVTSHLERLIAEVEGRPVIPRAAEAVAVAEARNKLRAAKKAKKAGPPRGSQAPSSVQALSTNYVRDPLVKAWVLERAAGKCEACTLPAPFVDAGGLPFLEVHHVRHLADRGSDTVTNAVALCPNCHRRLHYGRDKAAYREKLFTSLSSLTRE